MTNLFLKINKDLFKLKLNPTEILVLAQVMEFNTNTNDCFISNKVLSEQFGVSESTIKRALDNLSNRGFIARDTKNVKGGKVRHMLVNIKKIEEELTKLNLNLVDETNQPTKVNLNLDKAQNEPCSRVKMNLDKAHFEPIKDNIKDKEKKIEEDKIRIDACASIPANQPKAIELDGIKAQLMTKDEAMEKYGLGSCANSIPTAIPNVFWIKGELVQFV